MLRRTEIVNISNEGILVEYPMVVERILMHEIMVARNIQTWTPEAECAYAVVPMTAHELAWFTRL